MESSFDNRHRTFLNAEDDSDSECPPSSASFDNGSELTITSIKKPSRKSVQKRVVSVPIKETGEDKMKREITAGSNSSSSFPPSDSWSWRKYGQKPIKGSPYPRAYYRCSSSRGCPARKQVERSRADPTALLVTYCSDHNHPANASRNKNQSNNSTAAKLRQPMILQDTRKSESEPEPEPDTDEQFSDDFGWFRDMEAIPSTLLESPIYVKTTTVVDGGLFQMREEDESLFADLDELPECSLVFRRGRPVQINDEQLRQFTSPCCGTTS